jgi:hypothetical protein
MLQAVSVTARYVPYLFLYDSTDMNLIESGILRIRAAEQRVCKESGLASWMEIKRRLVPPVGWCALAFFFFFQHAYKKKGKFEVRLLSLFTVS